MKKVIFIISFVVFAFGIWAIATNRQQAYNDAVFMNCQSIYPGNSAADAINRESCNNRAKGNNGTIPILAIVFGGIVMFATFQSLKTDKTEQCSISKWSQNPPTVVFLFGQDYKCYN